MTSSESLETAVMQGCFIIFRKYRKQKLVSIPDSTHVVFLRYEVTLSLAGHVWGAAGEMALFLAGDRPRGRRVPVRRPNLLVQVVVVRYGDRTRTTDLHLWEINNNNGYCVWVLYKMIKWANPFREMPLVKTIDDGLNGWISTALFTDLVPEECATHPYDLGLRLLAVCEMFFTFHNQCLVIFPKVKGVFFNPQKGFKLKSEFES